MVKLKLLLLFIVVVLFPVVLIAQTNSGFNAIDPIKIRDTNLTRKYITAKRIVWVSDSSGTMIHDAESVLIPGTGQADLNNGKYLTLINNKEIKHGLILDFGQELHGGIEIITALSNNKSMGKIRIRFGESVSEAMSDAGIEGATNDHAMRDFVIQPPWGGRLEIGNTGFRFIRIDLVDPDTKIIIKEISAILKFRDIPYLGSFSSNDERLNKIWLTGAYTVHLNMQDYLWDGIKRDQLVWVGDMHPEVMTISSVFGSNEVVGKSLDLARDLTPLPEWMNGISSYSIWWILIQRDWYYYQGDFNYLEKQKEYLLALLHQLSLKIDTNGKEVLDGNRFLDWPSSENDEAIHAGLQSLMIMAFQAGSDLCKTLDEPEAEFLCEKSIEKLRNHIPEITKSKQATALLSLSNLVSPEDANIVLKKDGVHRMSTFYGYYMLKAIAKAGDYQYAIDYIREYWGAMLDLGATTFWEDFNINWLNNAGRIDEIVPAGKIDVHKTYGAYCYKQFRHSLCHGWASGPTSWLTQYVLGVSVIDPGCKTIKIEPHLGDLDWVKGTFPTPYGVLEIEHKKTSSGGIETFFKAPPEVNVILFQIP